MKTSKLGISLIKHYESLNDSDLKRIGLQPKEDPKGIITAGWGRALKDLNGKYLVGVDGYRRMLEIYPELDTMTEEDADEMLAEDLEHFEDQLNSLKLDLKQYEFDALISFIFNCGFGNFLSSTLYKRIKNRHGDIQEAFLMWNKSGGKVLNGLINRRKSEADLFIYGELEFYN